MPDWISSARRRAPVESQSSRAAAKNSCVTGWMPPSPWMGSMQMAQTSLENFGAEVGDVVEADELDAGHDGLEGLAVFFFVRRGDGAHGAAVEAVFEGEELCADGAAFGAEKAGVGAGRASARPPRLRCRCW